MKITNSVLVVLFVLLTAQIASAYYCPSTGRWLSRDPVDEPGFRNAQTAPSRARIRNPVLQSSGLWLSRDPIGDQVFDPLAQMQKDEEKAQREKIRKSILSTEFSRSMKLRLAEIWQVNLDAPVDVDRNSQNLYVFNFNAPGQSVDALGLSGCDYGCFRLSGSPIFICSLYTDDCDGKCYGAMVVLFPNIDGHGVVWFFHYHTPCPGCKVIPVGQYPPMT